MSLEQHLARIASALERIADALGPAAPVVIDGVEHIGHTLTRPPLAWFDAGNGCAVAVDDSIDHASDGQQPGRSGQTTWDWLGITPPATRTRQKMPESGERGVSCRSDQTAILSQNRTSGKNGPTPIPEIRQKGAEPGNTRAGQCGRCGRAGRRRLNFKPYCIDCKDEPEWDE